MSEENKKMFIEVKELTALETLEDYGFEILNLTDEPEYKHLRKIVFALELFIDGDWNLCSTYSGGENSDLAHGSLKDVMKKASEIKKLFKRAIKELDKF